MKQKRGGKLLVWLLAALMLIAFAPVTVLAEEAEEDTVEVIFDGNGGVMGAMEEKTWEVTGQKGYPINFDYVVDPVWAGEGRKVFTGWYTEAIEGNQITWDYEVWEDTRVYAHWADAAELTYNANGGVFKETDSEVVSVLVAEGSLFGENPTDNPEWAGEGTKVFDGWYTKADGGERIGDYEVEEDLIVYAHWIDGVEVTFDANGGVFEEEDSETISDILTKGFNRWLTSYDIKDPVWAGEGTKVFIGWYDDPEDGEPIDEDLIADEDLTIYAHWTDGVKVTYKANGGYLKNGEDEATQTLVKGDTFSGYGVPKRYDGAHLAFDGWYTKANGGDPVDETSVVNYNLTVYAHWTDDAVLLTLNANGGGFGNPDATVLEMRVPKGSCFGDVEVDTPSWFEESYENVIDGWYTEAGDEGYFIDDDYVIDESIEIYAHWADAAEIEFNCNGGIFPDGHRDANITVPKGRTFSYDKTPVWDGEGTKVFDGWYTDPEGGTLLDGDYIVDGYEIFYAHWIDGAKVRFFANGGKFAKTGRKKMTVSVGKGRSFSDAEVALAEDPVWSGEGTKLFDGWYTEANGGELVDRKESVLDGDLTVYAHWIDGVKVTFNANGGMFKETGDATWTETFPKGFTGFNKNYADEPVWNGEGAKLFAGWYTKATGGSRIDDSYAANKNLIVYAHWDDGYLITYNANGGTFGNGETEVTQAVAKDSAFINCATPEWAGEGTMAFVGWYTDASDGDLINEESIVNDNLTVYAHWTEGVVVTCNANGGVFNDAVTTIMKKTVAKESNFGATGIGDSDYTPRWPEEGEMAFDGWYTKAIGGYHITDDYVINKDIEIYAQWVDGVLIEYDCNGGWFPDGDGSGREITFPKGSAFSNYKTPVWEGEGTKTFAGWYTDPVGGELLDENYILDHHMSVFAHWTDDTISNPEDVTDATVTVSPQTFTYDGKKKTPNVKVVLSGKELKKDTDYTVSFRNNKNAGEALVTITGIGNYSGACKGSFMIEKAASTVTLNGVTSTYNGKAVDGIKATVAGSSGKIKYTYYSDKACKKEISVPKNAGIYFVKATVAADANYLEATSKAATIIIKKAANPLKVKAKSLSVKLKKVLAKDKRFAKKQAFVISKAQGAVAFKKVKGDKKITISRDGMVTVKKGAKRGKHTIYVNVTAKGNSNYNKGTKKGIKVTVVVK